MHIILKHTNQVFFCKSVLSPAVKGLIGNNLSRGTRFPTMWYVRLAKAQTSLRIHAD